MKFFDFLRKCEPWRERQKAKKGAQNAKKVTQNIPLYISFFAFCDRFHILPSFLYFVIVFAYFTISVLPAWQNIWKCGIHRFSYNEHSEMRFKHCFGIAEIRFLSRRLCSSHAMQLPDILPRGGRTYQLQVFYLYYESIIPHFVMRER